MLLESRILVGRSLITFETIFRNAMILLNVPWTGTVLCTLVFSFFVSLFMSVQALAGLSMLFLGRFRGAICFTLFYTSWYILINSLNCVFDFMSPTEQ